MVPRFIPCQSVRSVKTSGAAARESRIPGFGRRRAGKGAYFAVWGMQDVTLQGESLSFWRPSRRWRRTGGARMPLPGAERLSECQSGFVGASRPDRREKGVRSPVFPRFPSCPGFLCGKKFASLRQEENFFQQRNSVLCGKKRRGNGGNARMMHFSASVFNISRFSGLFPAVFLAACAAFLLAFCSCFGFSGDKVIVQWRDKNNVLAIWEFAFNPLSLQWARCCLLVMKSFAYE